jgi:hypothetical protein
MYVVLEKLKVWGSLVRFSHSIFALPFAGIMLVVLMHQLQVGWKQLVLLLICVVTARFAAMACNRLADARIDELNERTKNREIPGCSISICRCIFRIGKSLRCTFDPGSCGVARLLLCEAVFNPMSHGFGSSFSICTRGRLVRLDSELVVAASESHGSSSHVGCWIRYSLCLSGCRV